MEAATSKASAGRRVARASEVEQLVDYCSRPGCRKEFRRQVGRGRRQAFCSPFCRRMAEKELRQARSRLAHFEDLVEKLRIDVAAFGRPDRDDGADESLSINTWRTAENAVQRTAGALAFADPNEPAVRELKMLYQAVAPIILPGETS
jgi:hypothetical protein